MHETELKHTLTIHWHVQVIKSRNFFLYITIHTCIYCIQMVRYVSGVLKLKGVEKIWNLKYDILRWKKKGMCGWKSSRLFQIKCLNEDSPDQQKWGGRQDYISPLKGGVSSQSGSKHILVQFDFKEKVIRPWIKLTAGREVNMTCASDCRLKVSSKETKDFFF